MEPSSYDSFSKNMDSIKRHYRKNIPSQQQESYKNSMYKAYHIVNSV